MSSTHQNVQPKEDSWHLRKELSVGTILSLFLLSLGSLGAYYSATAQIGANTEKVEKLEDVPARVVRIETQLEAVSQTQREIQSTVGGIQTEQRAISDANMTILSSIRVTLARLEQKIEDIEEE